MSTKYASLWYCSYRECSTKIIYDSEVQIDNNKCFLSIDMKDIKEITCMFDAPIELREYEYLKINCPTIESIVKKVDLLHQLRRK